MASRTVKSNPTLIASLNIIKMSRHYHKDFILHPRKSQIIPSLIAIVSASARVMGYLTYRSLDFQAAHRAGPAVQDD